MAGDGIISQRQKPNKGGLAIGIACCILIPLWANEEVSYQAVKAALTDPAEALRYE
jgi:hypothetical protein